MIKRNNNLDKNKTINRRLFIIGTAKVGLLGLITSRLYNLQISEKKNEYIYIYMYVYIVYTHMQQSYTQIYTYMLN